MENHRNLMNLNHTETREDIHYSNYTQHYSYHSRYFHMYIPIQGFVHLRNSNLLLQEEVVVMEHLKYYYLKLGNKPNFNFTMHKLRHIWQQNLKSLHIRYVFLLLSHLIDKNLCKDGVVIFLATERLKWPIINNLLKERAFLSILFFQNCSIMTKSNSKKSFFFPFPDIVLWLYMWLSVNGFGCKSQKIDIDSHSECKEIIWERWWSLWWWWLLWSLSWQIVVAAAPRLRSNI